MGKGDKGVKVRRNKSQSKSKARQARRMESSPTVADRKKLKSKFVPLEQIKELPPTARDFLQENGFDEGYFDRKRGDFVARRGNNVIRGGKITPHDWARA